MNLVQVVWQSHPNMISMIRSIFKLVVSVMWNFSGVVLVIVKEAITDSMFPLFNDGFTKIFWGT
jgi:hypothetical protein